ncbi:hypothetical protein F7725_005876 [Dissostichus mawsoni]|uniref:Ovochymase-2-like n=1 Tax=Dissostichus mawsoni TaxID=36200 RepID=A0A7J5YUL9_DISMA|nr:hypothetical protein F7725_005876 [Dissostichus mawsoni]
MDEEKGSRRSRGCSTLEKCLIFLFVAMTGVCIGLVVVYFTEKNSTTLTEGLRCGGPQELSGESGAFTSYNYPNSYDNGKSCTWQITVDPDKVIQLWFEEFAVEDTELCTKILWLHQTKAGGVSYKPPDRCLQSPLIEIAGAGGYLQGDRGDLMTPGFPEQNYPNGALYQWKITVPEGERVRLTFTSFDLVPEVCGDFIQPVETSGNTMVLRFKTDNTLTSKGFRATFTKSSLPPVSTTPKPSTTTTTQTPPPSTTSGGDGPVIIKGRKGEIHSPGYPNAYPAHQKISWKISVPKGFLVKLQFTDMAITGEIGQCKEDKLIITDNYSTLDPGLWLFSRAPTGVIKSQNWPMNYKANAECMWNIDAPFNKRITLNLTHFDLEAKDFLSSKCYDNIVVFDINSWTNALIQKHGPFCGTKLPATILTKGNRLVIRFHSDLFTESKGFRAYWTRDPSLPAPTEPPVPANPWDDIDIEWPPCGRPATPPSVTSRIVNGEPATPHSWPWQVSMQVWPASRPEPTFFHTCGGTLIHKNWVMTAAHCFINYADELQRWNMCLGKHNLTFTEPSQRCFNVTGIYRHEGFKYPTVPTVEFDIALVRLDGDVTPSNEISFACLPSVEEVLPATKKCYATGWGDETGDSMNAKVAEALNQVALPVVPYDTCKRMDYWWFQVKTTMICCGYTLPDELQSVCQGDSGGPLVCQDTAGGPWEVHGITSFGPIGCIMNKKPSVFTRSSAYIPWIGNVIRRDLYNQHTSGCGGPKDLIGTKGTVSSMGFPGNYDNKARCEWTIQVPEGQLVHLHFSNFSLEESQLCLNDKVSIRDGVGSLGTHCNHLPPTDLVSDGNKLHISFSSNDKVVDTGFTATWRGVSPTEAPCGGSFNTAQGEINSPNWPNDYQAQSVCTWRITIPAVKSVHIGFTHFELQAANMLGNCVDYVEVFNGETMASLGRFCGFAPPSTLTIPGGSVVIRFLSNGADHQKGFRGYWTNDVGVIPTLPPTPPNPWDNITITWPVQCGNPAVKPKSAAMRVVNGVEATPHSWPWQVSMQASPMSLIPYMHGCGGSLIHEDWILTAAHCFMFPLSNPSYWRMCLGKHHMNSSMDVPSAEECFKVDSIIRHEGFVYEQDPTDISNDIALVHLATAVNMTKEISPVCLPKPGAVMPAGTPCYVTGWGDEKALPIVDFQTCSKPAYWWDSLRPSMICAGYESPDELKSACQGDSGGPFACSGSGTTPWEVHGIVSFGPQGCIKDKKPSVFTRVSAFSDWIDTNIKKFIHESGKTY